MSVPHDRVHAHDSVTHSAFNALDWVAMVLMIIGGLNWGLVGAADFDLVALLFGEMTLAARAVYILVGLAALYGLYVISKFGRSHR
jgi:uncharacterized membrane protein YuzA (DUF378 family)